MKKTTLLIPIIGLLWLTCVGQEEKATVNYQEVRIKEMNIGVQTWTFRKFSFFESVEKVKALGLKYLEAYPGQILSKDDPDVKFDHYLNEKQMDAVKQALGKAGITLAGYGVVKFENNEQSMREVFDFAKKMGIRTIVTEPDYDDFSLIEKMVKEYNIRVAVHNHPAPSRYARPEAVLRVVNGLDPRIGACADVGHWVRTGVNVIDGLRMLKDRILDVHLEDLDTFGSKDARTVPFGRGKTNIHDLLAELTLQHFDGILAIELEQEDETFNPSQIIRKGLEYIDSITYYKGYEELLSFRQGKYAKHGWNHYGPGYFELDRETGVLKTHGGMGLLWYSVKKYKDFVLELDFKCSDFKSNSGIFLRVPDVPVSDNYIYHSFEIQIDDASEGVHKTAAVYDAEAPKMNASRPTGEWNHYKITFKGSNIRVELNGKEVIDWMAEPRGKVADFAREGYIGLQNHDWETSVSFRNIFIKEIE